MPWSAKGPLLQSPHAAPKGPPLPLTLASPLTITLAFSAAPAAAQSGEAAEEEEEAQAALVGHVNTETHALCAMPWG